jgi:hypothetical protein
MLSDASDDEGVASMKTGASSGPVAMWPPQAARGIGGVKSSAIGTQRSIWPPACAELSGYTKEDHSPESASALAPDDSQRALGSSAGSAATLTMTGDDWEKDRGNRQEHFKMTTESKPWEETKVTNVTALELTLVLTEICIVLRLR